MSKQTKSASNAKKAMPAKSADDAFVSDDAISSGSANYLKLDKGETKIRVISKPIVGWLEWIEDGEKKKPVRSQINEQPETSDEENPPKKFMAMVVIDRKDNEVKIMEITQQSIIKKIKTLSGNPAWGNPFTYDICITKSGEGMKTKYEVTPEPRKPLEGALKVAASEKPCNLDALYEGEDPWKEENHADGVTEYFFK